MAAKSKTAYPMFMATNRKVTKTDLTEDRSNTQSFFECSANSPMHRTAA